MAVEARYTPVKLVHFNGDGDWVALACPMDDIRTAKRIAMAYAAENEGCLGAGVMDGSFFVHEVTARGWRYASDRRLEASAA
jgi:hypothetical protein